MPSPSDAPVPSAAVPGDGPVVAVLTAAGSGTRLGAGGPKALVPVGGQSLLLRSARGLLDSGVVDRVVVTAPADDVARFRSEVAVLGERVAVVAGSPASRQASVARGLEAALLLEPSAAVVLVHDAARALTPPEVVVRVVEAVRAGHRAVVPALPVTDTVKEVAPATPVAADEPCDASAGAGGAAVASAGVEIVIGTPDRSRMRAVQTPQGFDASTLVEAHRLGAERAGDEALAASDDAGLVEAAGGTVAVVAGHPMALKVTTPLDLALAEVLVAGS